MNEVKIIKRRTLPIPTVLTMNENVTKYFLGLLISSKSLICIEVGCRDLYIMGDRHYRIFTNYSQSTYLNNLCIHYLCVYLYMTYFQFVVFEHPI